MSNVSRQNSGYKYLLILIDDFSRYAYAEPVKDKNAKTVVKAMKRVLERMPKTPLNIRHDAGKEFVNKEFTQLMKDKGINNFVATTEVKANYAERFIRTLKNRLNRYMTANKTKKYSNVLQDTLNAYNNSVHSSIGMRPSEVNAKNELALWEKLYLGKFRKNKKHKFKQGQQVRVRINKKPFEKGYTPNWSNTVYEVTFRHHRNGLPIYEISDLTGQPVDGKFYEPQLQGVKVDTKKKILGYTDTRGRGPNKEYYVQWQYYGPRYDR